MRNGKSKKLANLKPFPPGVSGNPAGRPTAGATVREWVNMLVTKGFAEKKLREIAKDTFAPSPKRMAAQRILIAIESADLADFQPLMDGKKTVEQMRAAGVNTAVIKKFKVKSRVVPIGDGDTEEQITREIELYDRGGQELDRIFDHTEISPSEIEKYKRIDAGESTENFAYVPAAITVLDLPKHLKSKALPPPTKGA